MKLIAVFLLGAFLILPRVAFAAAKTANTKDFVDTRFIEELDRSGFIDAQ